MIEAGTLLLGCASSQVRPNGIILFHEPDRGQMRSVPPVPTYDRTCQWVSETYRRTGADTRIGTKLLYSKFLAAGLAAPTMRLHAVIGGATALETIRMGHGLWVRCDNWECLHRARIDLMTASCAKFVAIRDRRQRTVWPLS
jgi:hypothetical protein